MKTSFATSVIIAYVAGRVFHSSGKIDKFSVFIFPKGDFRVHVGRQYSHSMEEISLSDFKDGGFDYLDRKIDKLICDIDRIDGQKT